MHTCTSYIPPAVLNKIQNGGRYGWLELPMARTRIHGPFEFERTRVDCIFQLQNKMSLLKNQYFHQYLGASSSYIDVQCASF